MNRMILKRGFTLIEVLTVVAIIGVLVTITTYVYNSSLARSRDSQRRVDLKSIQNTLEQYYLENRSYPNFIMPDRPDNSLGYPWVAKFELEKFPSGAWPCTQPANKTFIAPKLMSSIPEDPHHKLRLAGSCVIDPEPGKPRGANQYIYLPFMTENNPNRSLTGGYYLMAKMERRNNVTPSLTPIKQAIEPYAFTKTVFNLPAGSAEEGNGGQPWMGFPYYYCSQAGTTNPVSESCHFNFFLSNNAN